MSLQSIAPSFLGVLKFDPKQPRHPKGSGEGGRFAKSAEVEQLHHILDVEADANYRRFEPEEPLSNNMLRRALMKQQIHGDLVERLRKNPLFAEYDKFQLDQFVQDKLDTWAQTSGDSSVEAVKMQDAVRLEFGLEESAMEHLDASYTPDPVEESRNRAFVRAEYERTQEFLEAQGITHVSLFRGMSARGADLGYEDREGHMGIEVVTMQPASSWTTKLRTAYDFAKGEPDPVVLTTRVPASQVLSTCVTGRGCLSEYEIILLGKEQRVRTFNVYNEETNEREENFLENIEKTLQR